MASERSVNVGGIQIGGGAPVVVQSMTLTKTHDVPATTAQIASLVSAGCEIVRVAVPKLEDAEALPRIIRFSPVPIIADIHFNASLALKAIDAGVAAVRINPGNIGGPDKVVEVVNAAKKAGIPMRIGANSGSLPKHLESLAHEDQAEALVEAALEEVRLLEQLDYYDFKISVKSSHVPTMIRAYRMLAGRVPYPLHLGVTEAGPPFTGSIKSAVGMGSLLADGIGDTIRVSLTADPVEEVKVCWEILKALNLRERGPVLIACPSCGRDNVGVQTLAEEVEDRLGAYEEHFEVAVLGCAVNGPGESGDADFGIAGGRDVGFIYAHGKVLRKVESEQLIDELFNEIDRWIAAGHAAPGAPEDGQAGRARHGRSVGHPARIASRDDEHHPGLHALSSDAARGACRRGGGQPQAARPRRLHPPGQRRALVVHAARLARAPQGRADHPRGDGRDRRAGVARARAHPGRAVGGDRPRQDPGALPPRGSRGTAVRAPADARGDVHLPRARAPELQAAAAVPGTTSRPRTATSRARAAACSASASSS